MSHKANDSNALAPQPAWLEKYIDSPQNREQLYRRTLMIVVISQIFGGAGLAAGITVGALLAQDMLGTDRYAGVPTMLFTLGSAGAALLVGRLSQRYGRRLGLAAGFLSGGIGAIGVIISALANDILLLLISLLIYGAGTATNLLARYAGTDLASSKQRAQAVSIALVSTTFGAVAGPNLVDVMGKFALSIGVPALAGPFILAAAAFILAGIILLVFLRPDPLVVAKAIAIVQETKRKDFSHEGAHKQEVNKRGIVVGAVIMVITQIVMVSIMTMTPVHMKYHGHGLSEVGMVIGFHVAAMFLPSLATGFLVDKFGRTVMAIASGATLLIAGILAAFTSGDSLLVLTVALALLGLGWNFGLISGTALIVDATTLSTRAKTQGKVDVLIALAGASGGALSGIVAAQSSYTILALTGGLLALLLIPAVIWSRKRGDDSASQNLNGEL